MREARMTHQLLLDVAVQYFQSVIAIELGVAGALLFEIRFFDRGSERRRDVDELPDPRLSALLAGVLGATVFGSLWAILHHGQTGAAIAVTIGLAVSLLPILLRVLPPLAKDVRTQERDSYYLVAIVGLLVYTAAVAGFIVLLAT
jgi:hypothetical protein